MHKLTRILPGRITGFVQYSRVFNKSIVFNLINPTITNLDKVKVHSIFQNNPANKIPRLSRSLLNSYKTTTARLRLLPMVDRIKRRPFF